MVSEVHRAALDRFEAACREDARVVVAFLGGSRIAGTDGEYSDLDLYLIVRDEDYDAFFAERRAFLGRLGEPVFLEDFSGFGLDMIVFIFAKGVKGELAFGHVSGFDRIHAYSPKCLEGVLSGIRGSERRVVDLNVTGPLGFWECLA